MRSANADALRDESLPGPTDAGKTHPDAGQLLRGATGSWLASLAAVVFFAVALIETTLLGSVGGGQWLLFGFGALMLFITLTSGITSLGGVAAVTMAIAAISSVPDGDNGATLLVVTGASLFAMLIVADLAANLRRHCQAEHRPVVTFLSGHVAALGLAVVVEVAAVSLARSQLWQASMVPVALTAVGATLVAVTLILIRLAPDDGLIVETWIVDDEANDPAG